MKKLLLGAAALLSASTQAQTTSPDMIVQARLDSKTASWLVAKTRVLMANTKVDDKLQGTTNVNEIPLISLANASHSADFIKLRKMLSAIFKVDFEQSALRIRIPSVQYRVETIELEPTEVTANDPNLFLSAKAGVRGIYANLNQGLMLDFVILNPKTNQYDSYLTARIDPTSIEIPRTLPALPLSVKLQAMRGPLLSYKLLDYNFGQVEGYVQAHQAEFQLRSGKNPFSAANISVNPVIIRLNELSRSVSFDEFKPIVQKALPEITRFTLNQVARVIKDSLGPKILTTAFSAKTRSDLISVTPYIYTRFSTEKFSQPDFNQLSLRVNGDLCTAKHFQRYQTLCTLHEPSEQKDVQPIREISPEDQKVALQEITDTIRRGTNDVVFSASEEYMNRLLRMTVNADLWTAKLKAHSLQLGPKAIFLVFDEKTKTPQLYLDLIYSGTGHGIQGALITERHPIRFPLRISTALKFENRKGVPFLTITTQHLLSDENEIVAGLPEYGIPSKLLFAFRHKVAKTIVEMAAEVENQVAVEMDLPVFQNVDLEDTSYEISEHGRLNLFFKL